jgi:hypothetical protein
LEENDVKEEKRALEEVEVDMERGWMMRWRVICLGWDRGVDRAVGITAPPLVFFPFLTLLVSVSIAGRWVGEEWTWFVLFGVTVWFTGQVGRQGLGEVTSVTGNGHGVRSDKPTLILIISLKIPW